MQPAYAANMWNEALNKRLGTEVTVLHLRLLYIMLFHIVRQSVYFFFVFLEMKDKRSA